MTTRDKDKEALSALMDGESQELELRRSLDSVEDDDALRAWWSRQQQVSEILQSQRSSQTGLDVSARVRRHWRASLSFNAIRCGAWRLLPRSHWLW